MTVVYIDTLFLLNAIIDYLLLLASARLAGEPLHRGRMALAAALGGLYAAAVFLPGTGFLLHPLCKLAAAVLMVLLGLGGSRRLLRQTVIFFALSCALGGGILAIGLLGGQGPAFGLGVVYTGMDLKILLLSAAACYAVLTFVLGRIGRHSALSGEVCRVELHLGERRAALTALVDTGNTLTDPISGQPVIVAEGRCLSCLFPGGSGPGPGDLASPADALPRLNAGPWRGRFRLLPYRSVGVDHGLLLAVRVDRACLDGRERGPALVALSPTPVSDGGGYCALVST